MKNKLPKKLSATGRVALKDIAMLGKQKGYKIDMNWWHTSPNSSHSGKCEICWAGSVMAGTFRVERELTRSPFDLYHAGEITRSDECRLAALDYLRMGAVVSALKVIGVKRIPKDLFIGRGVTSYKVNPAQWRKDMFKIIRLLEKHNL